MKKIMLVVLLIVCFGLFADGVLPTGTGTSGDPYQISTLDNLLWVSTNDTSWSSHFIQTADIDASDTSTWPGGEGFSPIGDNSTRFTGNYNGQGYEIDGLYINRPSYNYQGFFGYTDNAGISNLGVSNVDITGNGRVGGLAGVTYSSAVMNCYSSGTVTGMGEYVGGLLGLNTDNSNLSYCYSTGSVSGLNFTGGLVGVNQENSSMSDCFSSSNVTGSNSFAAGLTAVNQGFSSITDCYSYGLVNAVSGAGGLISYSIDGTTTDSFWDTQTSGQNTSGDGTGKTTAEMTTESTYTNAGWDFVGENTNGTEDFWEMDGLNNDGYPFLRYPPIVSTTTATQITQTTASSGGNVTGGANITSRGVCWSTMANPTTSDSYTSDGTGTGVFTSSLLGLSASTEYYYRAYATNSVGTSYGNEYTFITSPQGSGTSGDPYQISSLIELRWLSENSASWGSYFIQTADINASDTQSWNGGDGFSPIGNYDGSHFRGNYDGQGYEIVGLYIDKPSSNYVGLFGIVSEAQITNLGLSNADIVGQIRVGGLVGFTNQISSITNCYFTGSVNGTIDVGGLVGKNTYESSITNCYSTGSVHGNLYVGGLVGWNDSSITRGYSTGSASGTNDVGGLVGRNNYYSIISNSYSTGSVGGSNNIGGLVGYNDDNSSITYSYSTGSVSGTIDVGGLVGYNDDSTVTNSFWDTSSSEQGSSAGGTGKTTAEMQMESTFTDGGWDFVGETTNGTDDYWVIPLNTGYPVLTWQVNLASNFYAVPTEVYIGTEIQFTDISFGFPSNWQWDFENDGTYDSTVQNPVHSYSTSGTYSVKLTVSNGGNSSTIIKTDYINVISSISAPQNMQVEISGGDAVVSWDEVTEDGDGNPITPDGYIVKYSEDGVNYFFLSFVSTGTSFTQIGVALYSPNMFYESITVFNSSSRQLSYLQELNNSRQKVKWEDVKRELDRSSN